MTPEEKKAYDRAYYADRAEERKAYQRRYSIEHAEEIRTRKRAYYAVNTAKIRERQKAYYAANLESQRSWHRRHYAENAEEKKAKGRMRARQKLVNDPVSDISPVGPCEICGTVTKLHWDHDHQTEKFRGWICNPCNRGLGFFRDDPLFLSAAAEYLSRRLLRVV